VACGASGVYGDAALWSTLALRPQWHAGAGAGIITQDGHICLRLAGRCVFARHRKVPARTQGGPEDCPYTSGDRPAGPSRQDSIVPTRTRAGAVRGCTRSRPACSAWYLSLVVVALAVGGMYEGLAGRACQALEPPAAERASAQPAQGNETQPPSAAEKGPPTELEDPVEPLPPQQGRSEAQSDRIEALALFGAGRREEQAGRTERALQYYQRALRRDPTSAMLARHIVELCVRLGRDDEAIRYAIIAVELGPADELLAQIGDVLRQRGEFAQALKIYEKVPQELIQGSPSARVVRALALGQMYMLTSQPEKAAEQFLVVMAALDEQAQPPLDPPLRAAILGKEPGRTYELFGDALLAAGRVAEAERAFQAAQRLSPQEGLHAYNMARVLHARQEIQAAYEALQPYFETRQSSRGLGPYELLKNLLTALGRADELVTRLKALHADDPGNVPLHYSLAEACRAAGMWEEAEQHFSELLARPEPTLEIYQALLDIYQRQKQPAQILRVLGHAAGRTGNLNSLEKELAALAADQGLADAVLQHAQAAYREDPDSLDFGARLAAALLALRAKRFDAADEFFNLAVKVNRQARPALALEWALGLLVAERHEASVAVLRRALDERWLPAEDPRLHYYLALALAMAKQHDEALAAARRAADLAGDSLRMRSRVPWVLYYAKRYDDAYEAYRQLVEQHASQYDNPEVRDVLREARLALSHICVLKNDNAQAEEWLEQVLDEFPSDIGAMNDLGYLWADQGKHLQRALRMVRAAVAAEPENAAYRDSLGWALYRLGRYEESLQELQRAAAREVPDAVILDHLGDAYLALGRIADARQAWQRALASMESEDPAKAETVRAKLQAHPEPPPQGP